MKDKCGVNLAWNMLLIFLLQNIIEAAAQLRRIQWCSAEGHGSALCFPDKVSSGLATAEGWKG